MRQAQQARQQGRCAQLDARRAVAQSLLNAATAGLPTLGVAPHRLAAARGVHRAGAAAQAVGHAPAQAVGHAAAAAAAHGEDQGGARAAAGRQARTGAAGWPAGVGAGPRHNDAVELADGRGDGAGRRGGRRARRRARGRPHARTSPRAHRRCMPGIDAPSPDVLDGVARRKPSTSGTRRRSSSTRRC